MLQNEPASHNEVVRYPICVQARQFNKGGLLLQLSHQLSLPLTKKYLAPDGSYCEENELNNLLKNTKKGYVPEVVYFYKNRPFLDFLASFLNESNACLLVDGLDEVTSEQRDRLEKDLTMLSHHLHDGKVIATCRTGDYTKNIEGFSVVEILPLSKEEILDISRLWLEDPQEFMHELNKKPYCDLADRPLFLTNLLLVYVLSGRLPEKGVDIYRKISRLLLEKWDEDRGVNERRTQYAHFLPERKADFISEFAWELTYGHQSIEFSENILLRIYDRIHSHFSLPKDEAIEVAAEIESHTGIIVSSGYEKYAFSHLTLQEYFSANYMLSLPYIEAFQHRFSSNPAPFAVAVSLSSEPSLWFSHLVLRHIVDMTDTSTTASSISRFIFRILIEKPVFRDSDLFGVAIAALESTCLRIDPRSCSSNTADFVNRFGALGNL